MLLLGPLFVQALVTPWLPAKMIGTKDSPNNVTTWASALLPDG